MGVKISELPAASALAGTESFPVVQAGETRQTTVTAALLGTQRLHGFPIPYAVTLTYSAANRQVTLTPTGSTFDIWLSGVKQTKTGAQVSPAHTNTTSNYFVYFDSTGTLQVSDTTWSINSANLPVCYVYYNATLVDGIALFELHTAGRNLEWHESQHFSLGTFVRSGLEISGYTLNTDTSNAVTFAIASGMIVDEDIEYSIAALADNGPYTILYRSGAAWTWTTNNVLPYRYSPGAYLNYNWDNAGNWTLADVSNGNWVNYYLFATTAIDTNKQLLIVPGQVQHTSLSSAQAESVTSLSWSDLAIPELAAVWKLTFRASSAYNGVNGKARLVEVNRLTQSKAQLSGNFTIGSHNSLNGRDAAESHPASAIVNIPAGNIVAVTVQAAIDELDSEKLAATAYTASDVLTKIKTVDGASSGLDADLLDGNHASAFATSEHNHSGVYEPVLGNPASDGQVLSSTTAGVRSWVAAGSPGLVLISTATASNSVSVDFTGIDSTYDEYEIRFQDMTGSSGAFIWLRTSANNGSSYDSGTSDYIGTYTVFGPTTTYYGGTASGTKVELNGGRTLNGRTSGIIALYRPHIAQMAHFTWDASNINGAAEIRYLKGGAFRSSSTAVNAIRIMYSTGNVVTGTFKLYGIRKA